METRAAVPIDTVDFSSSSATVALGEALARTGFVQLAGHGVDEGVRARYRQACDDFFALELEDKQRFVNPDPEANRGYRALGSESLSYSLGEASPPDLFESFNASVDPGAGVDHRLMHATPWPDTAVPDFSSAALAMVEEFAALAKRLDESIAELTGWSDLVGRSGAGPDTLVGINYRPGPDGTEEVADGQQRMGAHTDYTSFTILDADPVRGLQLIDPTGEWVDVTPSKDGLLVNVGDLLAVATNDRWPSTLHRVVPMAAGGAAHRRSVAYFHYPNLDVVVEPLPKFTHDEASKYDAVSVSDHLLDKLVSAKVREESKSTMTVAGRMDKPSA